MRVTFFFLLLLSLLIGSVSVLVYTMINKEMVGTSSPVESLLEWLPFYQSERIQGIRAAVLQSGQTADYMSEVAAADISPDEARNNYLQIAEFWKKQLTGNQINAELISDEALLNDLQGYNLLVIPSAYCLSSEQIDAVKEFLAQGKGVIMTHMSGNRRADGSSRDWSLAMDITGGTPYSVDGIEDKEAGRKLFFTSDNPIVTNTTPGYPLPVRAYDQPIGIAIENKNRVSVAAAWESPGGLLPRDPYKQAGVTYGEYRGGRFVWIGFTANSVPSIPEYWNAFDELLSNAINWTGWRAIVAKAPWPVEGRATGFSIMARNDLFRIQNLQEQFAKRNIVPAIFIGREASTLNHLGLNRLLEKAEFGPQLAAGSSKPPDGMDSEMLQRLKTERKKLQESLDTDIIGFSLPVEPEENLEQLHRLEFDYIWLESKFSPAAKIASTDLPNRTLFFKRRPQPPVFIPQAARSDRQLIEEEGITDPEDLLNALIQDFDSLKKLGALYTITLHPDLLGSNAYRKTTGAWLDHIDNESVWKASPGEIAQWWKKYEGIKLRVVEDRRRIVLRISNDSAQTVSNFRIFLYPRLLPESMDIRAERMRTPIPSERFDYDNNRIELTLEDMDPGENRTYYLDI